jgi:hypothetical protein
MKRRPDSTKTLKVAAQALFYFNTFIWLGFSLSKFLDIIAFNNKSASNVITGIFMLGNAAALFLSGWMIAKGRRWARGFALLVLAVNLLLTLTDQFGIFDLLTFLIDIVILWILISLRVDSPSKS